MDEVKKVANEILKNQLDEGETIFVKEIEDGIYFACIDTNRRGPGAVIIGEDLSYLWGNSAIGYSKLLDSYKKGERTEKEEVGFDVSKIFDMESLSLENIEPKLTPEQKKKYEDKSLEECLEMIDKKIEELENE